jgi:hypothetical protein
LNSDDAWNVSYEEFILISKEISTLENDMMELKESLSEWKNMPALLRIEDGSQAQGRSVHSHNHHFISVTILLHRTNNDVQKIEKRFSALQ